MKELEILQSRSEQHEQAVVGLKVKVDSLPEATKLDLLPRVERVSTMSLALKRDVDEAATKGGADIQTATELNETLEQELKNLIHEVETLSQGNPTTIDFVGDKLMNGLADAAGKIKEAVTMGSDDEKSGPTVS